MKNEIERLGSGAMFDAISARYDFMNRVLSFGIDRSWRVKAVAELELGGAKRVLDVATGTGDVALALARANRETRVVGVDPSEGMLSVAREKIARAGLDEHIELDRAHAEQLPFDADAFDASVIAFGIRNVVDRPGALREMRRVTRPGGRVVVLELSEPQGGGLESIARFHVRKLVPVLGGLLSGAREYGYLQRSIAAFPPPDDFARMLLEAGLEVRRVMPLTFGVAHLFVASVPGAA